MTASQREVTEVSIAKGEVGSTQAGGRRGTRRGDRYQLLLEIANLLTTKLEPDLLFNTIARVVGTALKIDRASLALYDPARDEFEVVALALQEHSEAGKGWVVPHQGSRIGKAFDEGRPFLSRALGEGVAFFEDTQLVKEGMHTGLTIPLLVDTKPVGTFNVNCRKESGLRAVDVELLAKIADQIAIAVSNSRAFQVIRREKEALKRENEYLMQTTSSDQHADLLLLNCPSMRPLLERLMTLSKVDVTVLISGETGTGKGVVARALHSWSPRRDRPFVKCDCAALAPTLIESELFGHERGAFTGAQARRIGRFELSHGGTIFLDEIAEMPLETQAKLLGVLEDRQLQRVGGTDNIRVDMRVIAATNRDMQEEIGKGRFRQDLFFRLNVVNIELKPLRERPADILALAQHFTRLYARTFGRSFTSISPTAMDTMIHYSWPGNIRELGNIIERAILLQNGPILDIGPEILGNSAVPATNSAGSGGVGSMTLAEVESRHIRAVLEETSWRIDGAKGAAKVLGVHPNTLRSRMARLNIRRPPRLAS
jgi:formate hydrogenlyase transcriptional activator